MFKSVRQLFALFSQVFTTFGVTHQFAIDNVNPSSSTLWMGFLFLVLLFALVVLFNFYRQLLSDTGALSTGIDAFQLISPIICHMILIAESLFSVQVMDRMWITVKEIQKLLEGTDLKIWDLKFFQKYCRKFLISQLIPIIVESYITLSISKAPEWQRHWIARTFSFNATRLATLHYILWVDYLASRGEVVSTELESLAVQRKNLKLAADFDEHLFQKVENLKKIHGLLWRLSQDVNRRFGIFLLSSMTNLFLSITIDFYWIYGNFRFGGNPFALRELMNFDEL